MLEDTAHLAYLGTWSNPIRIVYTYEEMGASQFWAIERDSSGALFTEEGGDDQQPQIGVFGLTAREALTLRDGKVEAGYQFNPGLSSPLISKSFPDSPFGEIRSFAGRLALDAKGNLIAEFPLDVVRDILGRYILV